MQWQRALVRLTIGAAAADQFIRARDDIRQQGAFVRKGLEAIRQAQREHPDRALLVHGFGADSPLATQGRLDADGEQNFYFFRGETHPQRAADIAGGYAGFGGGLAVIAGPPLPLVYANQQTNFGNDGGYGCTEMLRDPAECDARITGSGTTALLPRGLARSEHVPAAVVPAPELSSVLARAMIRCRALLSSGDVTAGEMNALALPEHQRKEPAAAAPRTASDALALAAA